MRNCEGKITEMKDQTCEYLNSKASRRRHREIGEREVEVVRREDRSLQKRRKIRIDADESL